MATDSGLCHSVILVCSYLSISRCSGDLLSRVLHKDDHDDEKDYVQEKADRQNAEDARKEETHLLHQARLLQQLVHVLRCRGQCRPIWHIRQDFSSSSFVLCGIAVAIDTPDKPRQFSNWQIRACCG